MLYTVEEFLYPYVQFKSSSINKNINRDEYSIVGFLSFHGISKEIEVIAQVEKVENELIGKTMFEINLDDFEIEKPSLLLIPIEESITIDVYLVGELD